MQITKLVANNFKILKAVEITPEGNTVKITGRNGQGKTSVLDAIWSALCGGAASKEIPQPIREGEETAKVMLEIGELVVTRTWTGKDKSYLVVENTTHGAKLNSPQAVLDGLIGHLAFDPLEFSNLNAKEQVAALLEVVELDIDPVDIAEKREGLYSERTEANREVKRLESVLSDHKKPEDGASTVEESIAEVMTELDKAKDIKRRQDALKVNCQDLEQSCLEIERRLNQEKADLQSETALLEEKAKELQAITVPDIEALQAKLNNVEVNNQKARRARDYFELSNELVKKQKSSACWTEGIEALDKKKADAIKSAKMPVDGLSFDEEGLIYKGVSFKQASSAEKLRVCVAMAMALNPKLRVIRITDGSLLDSESMKIIEEMAQAEDFQIWVEIVDETGEVGIRIEDGAIVK